MLTEAQAWAAVPPTGWLRDYVLYAAKNTTAPLAYHIGVGLCLLSVTCPPTYSMRYATPVFPNIFVMLAGRSGDEQKSTAIELGIEVLFKSLPHIIGEQPGSPEGLIETLQGSPVQLLCYKEGGKLLASTQRGYMEPLKALLTDLADGTPQQRVKASKQGVKQIVKVDHPRLSVLAGTSLGFLDKHTEPVDWSGGFLGRWFLIYAKRERTVAKPKPFLSPQAGLASSLAARAQVAKPGVWRGFIPGDEGFSPEADELWEQWFHDVSNRPMPDLVAGTRVRAPVFALRTAMLYGWDFGPAVHGEPWQITPDILIPGIRLAEMHLDSVASLAGQLSAHPEARARLQLLSAFTPGKMLTLGEVIGATKLKKKTVVEMLDSLCEEGAVLRLLLPGGQGALYQLPPSAPAQPPLA